MTTWTKVEKERPGRAAANFFAVTNHKGAQCRLNMPAGTTQFKSANIYISDDAKKVGFHFCDGGAYKVTHSKSGVGQSSVSIPKSLSSWIPVGTTRVVMEREAEFYVLDLTQLRAAQLHAAE